MAPAPKALSETCLFGFTSLLFRRYGVILTEISSVRASLTSVFPFLSDRAAHEMPPHPVKRSGAGLDITEQL